MPRRSTNDGDSGTNSKKPVKNVGGASWGSDTIIGTGGADTITGIPGTGALTKGNQNQVDILTGGGGADLFVLGDIRGAFYLNGNSANYGSGSYGDYAIITDFTPNEGDRIQLYDNATYLIVYARDISDADGDSDSFEGVHELYYYTVEGLYGAEPMAYIFTEDGSYNPTSIAEYFVASADLSLIEL